MSDSSIDAPVVLVHGIFGFNQLTFGGAKIADYFRHIPKVLREAGHVVPAPPRLDLAGSIAKRAQNLKDYLENPANSDVSGKRVHIVAHSMGGLDARFMIAKLGMEDRVISLTTITTPHQGSIIADKIINATDERLILFAEHLGLDINGGTDLTTVKASEFNDEIQDSPNVRYFCVAGSFEPPRKLGHPTGILGLTHDIIMQTDGDSDGLVSVNSATFGQTRPAWTFLDTWEGNHFRVINWGTDLIPTPLELVSKRIVDNYKDLVAQVKELTELQS